MWAQYRKTFFATQFLIAFIVAAASLNGRPVGEAVVELFVPMQLCAFLGAIVAARIKARLGQHP